MRTFRLLLGTCILPFVFLFGSYIVGRSQSPPNSLKIIPPSPTAAGLGKYGEIPMSYYSGSANVSVPLYEIKTTDLSLPIKLDYFSNGFKVSEEAGWVGLGWSLFAGGVITRTIKGGDDVVGFFKQAKFPINWEPDPLTQEGMDLINRLWGMGMGLEDSEPDIFNFNFGEHTGKFIIDKEVNGNTTFGQNVITAKSSNLRIEYKYDGTSNLFYFQVTDTNGIIYLFKETELTTDYDVHVPNYNNSITDLPSINEAMYADQLWGNIKGQSITSWYLTKIESPAGDVIDFEYESEYREWLTPKAYYEEQFIPQAGGQGSIRSNYHISSQVHRQVCLKKISFQNGYVLFNNPAFVTVAETEKLDVDRRPEISSRPKKLRSIEIFGNNNNLVKRYLLDYGYFNTTSAPDKNSRLRLNSVTELAADGSTSKPAHKFEYHNSNDLFPPKTSKAIDWFGFYNGQTGNVNVLPKQFSDGTLYVGANRYASENIDHYRMGLLKKVIYPTGGATDFEYELAEYGNNAVPPDFSSSFQLISHIHEWSNSEDCQTNLDPNVCIVPIVSPPVVWTESGTTGYTRVEFSGTYDHEIEGGSGFESFPVLDQFGHCSSDIFTTCGFLTTNTVSRANVKLEYWNNPNVNLEGPNPPAPTWSRNLNINNVQDCKCVSEEIYLEPGKYRLSDQSIAVTKGMNIYAGMSTYNLEHHKLFAGVRVKGIKNFDDAQQLSERKFIYTIDGQPTGTTSGVVLSPIAYLGLVPAVVGQADNHDHTQMLMRSSSSLKLPDFSSTGSLLGHTNVAEIFGPNENGGRIEYFFQNAEDAPSDYPGLPAYSWSNNGQLRSQTYKDKDGSTVKKIENEYTELQTFTVEAAKVASKIRDPQIWSEQWAHIFMYSQLYYNKSSWWELTKRTETSYSNNIAGSSNVTQYFYNNSSHKLQTSEETVQSDGSMVLKKYKRLLDYSNFNTSPVFSKMYSEHIIAPVIEEQTLVKKYSQNDYKLVSGYISDYKITSANIAVPSVRYFLDNKIPLSDLIESSINGGVVVKPENYVEQYTVDRYDNKGNVLSYHKANDNTTSFVWAYNYAYPVAEVRNATYDAIISILGQATIDALNSNPGNDVQLRQTLAILRTHPSLQKAQVYTYTYNPILGITSSTDQNNVTTYYEYDSFGRLSFVRNHNSEIINSYGYKYRTH